MDYRERKRLSVYNKFNGKCAYCGIKLNGIFHVDHLVPKRRYKFRNGELRGSDDISNLMPSCNSCNSCKYDLSLDEFRDRILDRLVRLNNIITEYQIAKRFGLIKELKKKIEFYFEKCK